MANKEYEKNKDPALANKESKDSGLAHSKN